MAQNFNFVGIILSALIALVESMIWYSPMLFATKWMADAGVMPADLSLKKPRSRNSVILSLVTYLIIAFALDQIIISIGSSSFISYLSAGFACWVGFVALTLLIRRMSKSAAAAPFAWTDACFYLIMLFSTVLILFVLQ